MPTSFQMQYVSLFKIPSFTVFIIKTNIISLDYLPMV